MKRTFATLGVVGLGLMGATVAANAAPPGKISICHATGSASNPYLFETISLNALSAHVGDTNDIVPVNSGTVMPNGQNHTAENLALLANGCVVPGPVVPVDPPVVPPVDPPVVPPVVPPEDPPVVPPVETVDPPAVVPPAVVPVDTVVPPAAAPPAAAPPAALPPAAAPPAVVPQAAAPVAPISAAPQAAAATGVPAASNVGYNVQTAVGSSDPGVPAWLAGLTVLFTAVGAGVLVKGSLRSRGANG